MRHAGVVCRPNDALRQTRTHDTTGCSHHRHVCVGRTLDAGFSAVEILSVPLISGTSIASSRRRECSNMSKATIRFIWLFCLLSVSIGLPGCNGPSPKNVEPAPTLSATQSWIKQHAIVLRTTDPRAP